jgi:succinate dehydrogenase/fumarate reductase cytochrome b subunit
MAYNICGGLRYLLMDFGCIKESKSYSCYPFSSGGDLSAHCAISFSWSFVMVNNVSSFWHNCIQDWLLLRASSIIIILYILYLIGFLSFL